MKEILLIEKEMLFLVLLYFYVHTNYEQSVWQKCDFKRETSIDRQ